jgi:type I restriction enzyme, S subunit
VSAYSPISMPLHWAEAAFDDLFRNVTSSSRKLPAGNYLTSGAFPVIDQGERYVGGFTNDAELVHEGALPVIVFGDHTRCIKYVNRPFVQGADGVKVLSPPTGLNPKLCYWALIQADIPSKGYARHFAILRALRLPLAPLREQGRIVEAIESYLTRLDDAMVTLERVQRNLKRYRASVLKAAVEGRLVPTEAELARAEGREYEPASVLLERILLERRRRWEEAQLAKMMAKGKVPKNDKWKAKYVEPVGPVTNELPELPEGWCWASVDQLAAHEDNSLADGPFGSNLKSSHYTASGPRVIRLQNIANGKFIDSEAHVSPEHYASLSKHSVAPGDVVIASLGTDLPRACVVPDWLGPAIVKADCLRFATYRSLLRPWFAVHALNSTPSRKRAEGLVHGVGRPRIGLTLLRQFPLPLPPLDEQDRILGEVEHLLSLSDAMVLAATHNRKRLAALRQTILKLY